MLRAGYGIYWAPWNYPAPSSATQQLRSARVHAEHGRRRRLPATPTVTLTNPFPNGLVAPLGNSLGALTGVGTSISYVDQNRTAPRVQQYLGRSAAGAAAATWR